jgi:hypothetical protein
MAKDRYDAAQWEFMNRPETQAKIRQSLKGYLASFIDSASDGRTQDRFLEVLSLLKAYFRNELEKSPTEYTELILATLSSARRRMPSEEKLTELMNQPRKEVCPEEWERFEEFLEREGLEGWWD